MLPILAGLLMGVACATPMLYVLGHVDKPDSGMHIGLLLACGLVPFMVLQAALVLVWVLWPTAVAGVGVSASLALLTVVVAKVLCNWKHLG